MVGICRTATACFYQVPTESSVCWLCTNYKLNDYVSCCTSHLERCRAVAHKMQLQTDFCDCFQSPVSHTLGSCKRMLAVEQSTLVFDGNSRNHFSLFIFDSLLAILNLQGIQFAWEENPSRHFPAKKEENGLPVCVESYWVICIQKAYRRLFWENIEYIPITSN